MFKRPEGRNVQTPVGSETAAEYFAKIQYSKKACFRKIPEADFVLIPLPMLETAIFPESVHSGIQQSVHSSYSLSFTTPALPGS